MGKTAMVLGPKEISSMAHIQKGGRRGKHSLCDMHGGVQRIAAMLRTPPLFSRLPQILSYRVGATVLCTGEFRGELPSLSVYNPILA